MTHLRAIPSTNQNEIPMDWQPYDPTWLVQWVREDGPQMAWLADALARCTRAASGGPAYLYFADPVDAGQPDAEWQLEETVRLDRTPQGTLLLDILVGRRVGGIEFMARL